MNWITNTAYKAFFIIYALGTVQYAYSLWDPASEIFVFYKLLSTFHPNYTIHYVLNNIAAFIGILALIPFGYHAFNKKSSLASYWKILIILRILFDLVGHFYEWQFLKSILHFGGLTTLATFTAFFVLHIPSYLAHYSYSFGKNAKQSNA